MLKLGSEGAYLAYLGRKGELIPAFAVEALDTTAAGDAFNGGFATGLMIGKSPAESAVFATGVAAISVTRLGAQPSMPSMKEVQQFLENRERGDTQEQTTNCDDGLGKSPVERQMFTRLYRER